jgi:hypothetical protein
MEGEVAEWQSGRVAECRRRERASESGSGLGLAEGSNETGVWLLDVSGMDGRGG